MTRITPAKPLRHVVIVDTNILWYKDKSVVVNPDFDSFWDEQSGRHSLSLVVPAVVRGELLYQQTASAAKALTKANEHLSEAAAVAGAHYRHRVTDARVNRDVERRLDRWLKRRRAEIVPVPYAKVNWPAIAEAAIWRRGPFIPDAKSPDAERGFRDAMILESVLETVATAPSGCQIAFICNDGTLRAVAEHRLGTAGSASCFESLTDFGSYLRLSLEKLTKEFVRAIHSRARTKFYAPDDPTSLYSAKTLRSRIKAEFASEFQWFGDPPGALVTPLLATSLFTSLPPLPSWTEASQEVAWVGSPEFTRLEGTRDFHWNSKVLFVQLFRRQYGSGLLTYTANPLLAEERLRVLSFVIHWHSIVKADGRFQGYDLLEISVSSKAFSQPSPDELKRYRLTPSEPSAPASTP